MRAARRARGSQTLASASVTRSTAPPSRKAGHPGSRSGHPARITARRTLSWSSWATHPPGGTSRFPPSRRRSTASNGRFLLYPDVAQFSHPSTSTVGTSRAQWADRRNVSRMLPLKTLSPQIQRMLSSMDALQPNSWCLEPSVNISMFVQPRLLFLWFAASCDFF